MLQLPKCQAKYVNFLYYILKVLPKYHILYHKAANAQLAISCGSGSIFLYINVLLSFLFYFLFSIIYLFIFLRNCYHFYMESFGKETQSKKLLGPAIGVTNWLGRVSMRGRIVRSNPTRTTF